MNQDRKENLFEVTAVVYAHTDKEHHERLIGAVLPGLESEELHNYIILVKRALKDKKLGKADRILLGVYISRGLVPQMRFA